MKSSRFMPSRLSFALAVMLAAGVAGPLVSDALVRTSNSSTINYRGATAPFDFGGFMSSLTNMVTGWLRGLQSHPDAVVAAMEKQDGASKELEQSDINYQAAQATSEAAQGAADLVGSALPDSCQFAQEKRGAIEAKSDARLQARAMTASTTRNMSVASNSNMDMVQTLKKAFGEYCSPESMQRGHCNQASPKNLPDADIAASSIMGTQDSESETLSDDEFDAAQAYVKMVTAPVPVESLPIAMEKTDAGQRYLIEQRRQIAITSSAQNSMNTIIASRRSKN